MPFDFGSMVETTDQKATAIPTTEFDFNSIEEPNMPQTKKVYPIATALRNVFKFLPTEQVRKYVTLGEQAKKGTLIKPTKGETFDKWMARITKDYEQKQIEQGVVRQVQDPMTAAVVGAAVTNPISTAAMVVGFSIKDHFFNGKRFMEEKVPNAPPLVKELVEIGDFIASGVAIGGAIGAAKGPKWDVSVKDFVMERFKNLDLPRAIQMTAEQIRGIGKKKIIPEKLGITKEIIAASDKSETPVQIPVDKVLDLAINPKWETYKEDLGLSKIKTSGEPIPSEQMPQQMTTAEGKVIPLKIEGQGESVISYVSRIGEKIYTKLTSEELSVLKDEVKNIPSAKEGESQIHLDAITPNLLEMGKEVPREEFIKGHSQAQEVFNKVIPAKPSLQIGEKERGFITSVKESPQVTKETKAEIGKLPEEKTTYQVITDKEALAKAQEKVAADPEGALAEVLTSEGVSKDITTTGIELMRKYREEGNIEQEVNVAENLARKGTEGGQFIQAFSILDKLSPDGVLVFAQRELNRGVEDVAKRKLITPEFADALKKQAQRIQDAPEGYAKVIEVKKLTEMIAEKKGRSASDWILEVANLPRTLAASLFDFSFGLRQGAFLLPSFPKEWGGAFAKQFGAFAKEENYNALMDSIMKHPDYQKAIDSGVAFTDIRVKLSKIEEKYMGANLAEKIPILGKGVIATQRAYTAMANKMRMDVFSKMLQDYENVGLEITPKLLKQTATFVNAGTGRGGLAGEFAKSAGLLNALFFSPRLMASRLTLLNPAYYVTREPGLRKQALKSLFSFIGYGASTLAIAKLMGAEVGTEPRSADFGKIKIGNTRIDTWGGFQQYVRMFAQEFTGEYVSSTTGKKITLGEGYRPLTRMEILMRQIESKEAPVFSLITKLLGENRDWDTGKKLNVPKEILQKFEPMVASDLYDLYQEDPMLLPLGALTVFGAGVQTYKQKKSNKF